MTESTPADLIYLDPTSQFEIRLLVESEYDHASQVLAPAMFAGTAEAARERIFSFEQEAKIAIYGGFIEHRLVAAYVLKRDGMANEIGLIAVDPDHRKRGIGKLLLQDALRRSGKRPLVAETDEETLGFYKACGFKLVGRRKHPSGTVRYRVGWHAPGLRFKGGSTSTLDGQPLKSQEVQD